ncbi:MAG TPA: alpha/beta fold hydrolase [Pyrinomonadaceae bacterium]
MPSARINNFNLEYTDSGIGRPIVLIHGYPFNRSLWTEQIMVFSTSFRVIAPDLRGFGDSDAVPGTATMDVMAQDVVLLLNHLGIARATICGLSMGGYVALALYKQLPSRVRALVLADTRASSDSDEAKQTRFQQAEKALSEGMASIADSMLPKLLTPETVSKRPEVVKHVRDMMLQTKREGAAAALRGMAERDDQTELLAKISVPTLVIVGAGDAITPVADSETMHRAIRDSRLVVLENAGHVSNLERTEQFNDALLEFLNRTSTDGS